ncbi:hypothetical protein A2W14_01940, partial [Candidatus Gottesmanbacteria bacterium RBG_16_37_8]
MKISVIIPNYNSQLLLQKNLPRVIAQSEGAEIIVVDDASDDDSVLFIKKNYPEVLVLEKKKNTGFSSTVNFGVKHAKGDLLIFLNSDVYPRQDYLQPLLPFFNRHDTFAVGMLQECYEHGRIVLRGAGAGEFKRGFLIHRRGDVNKNSTLWVSGGAGIFRKSVFLKLGGFREIYDPFYWEDIDLSYRAVKLGYKIYFERKSIVVHRQEDSSIRSKYTASRIKTIAYRNQFLFVWLNFKQPVNLLRHLLWLPLHLIKIKDKEFIRGLKEALFCAKRLRLI